MSADADVSNMREEVARRAHPTPEDRKAIKAVFDEVSARIGREAQLRGLNVRIEEEGSVAKDTWIASDRDIDIFIIFPRGTNKDKVKTDGLELAKSASARWKLGYAEHPYVEAEVDGFTLDIVPSLEMDEGERPVTAVDRTPLHTTFINSKLDGRMKDDVRVLKQFMKGIGVYGAELRIGGFSGYICELLVLQFGSFEKVIRAASEWRERTALDYMHHYSSSREVRVEDVFGGPVAVVDPIDMRRNAAAAISEQSYATFIAASRCFLKKPAMSFFYPGQGVAFQSTPGKSTFQMIMDAVRKKGSSVVGVVMRSPTVPSDILWGEIYKSLSKITTLLESNDFCVNDSSAWSDEREYVVLLVEVLGRSLPQVRVHCGPKVFYVKEADRFLEKYAGDERVLAGPYIKDGRWYVELKRKHTDVKALLCEGFPKLELSRDISAEVRGGFRLLVDGELEEICNEKVELGKALLKLVKKTPAWLNAR